MAKTIWKYLLNPGGETVLEVPRGARFLSLAIQGLNPYIWLGVDSDAPADEKQRFIVVGTGHDVPAGVVYRGSFMLMSGAFVGHVFEVDAIDGPAFGEDPWRPEGAA